MISLFVPFFAYFLAGELLVYLFIMFLAGTQAAVRRNSPFLAAGLPLAVAVMHISWGSGFLWSILKSDFRQNG